MTLEKVGREVKKIINHFKLKHKLKLQTDKNKEEQLKWSTYSEVQFSELSIRGKIEHLKISDR